MFPMRALREQIGTLLAADATTLAPAVNGNKIALIAANFTYDETLTIASLTFASFTGSAPLVLGTGAQNVGDDPASGEQVIALLLPAGGLRWTCTVAPVPPQTIYGYALTDNAGAVLLAVKQLPTAIAISAVGQQIVLDPAEIAILLNPWDA